MYPELDDDVQRLLGEENLVFDFNTRDDDSCTKDYDTNIMGRFTCYNNSCGNTGWSSKRIPITIRMYGDTQYNARVYHQRCIQCKRLSKPQLDGSYAERIAYRLKKWSGIVMEQPYYGVKASSGPHQTHLCEGCKNGHCKEGLLDSIDGLAILGTF